jgi:hypothetical protein
MRSLKLGIGTVAALLAVVAFAGNATAAKPAVWLNLCRGCNVQENRAIVGETGTIYLDTIGCNLEAKMTLLSNGKPVDRFRGSDTKAECVEGGNWAGELTGITIVASPNNPPFTATLHTKAAHELYSNPWCTYKLPSKNVVPGWNGGEPALSLPGQLDKGASFGECEVTRTIGVGWRFVGERGEDSYEPEET